MSVQHAATPIAELGRPAISIRPIIVPRWLEYPVLLLTCAAAAYTLYYAVGTYNDVQYHLAAINALHELTY